MRTRGLVPGKVAWLCALVVGLLSVPPTIAAGEVCPNALRRVGPSASLPDCRAYELVSPAVRGDNSLIEGVHGFGDGQHVYFESKLPLPGAGNGEFEQGLSSRTGSGWVTTALTPPAGPGEPIGLFSGAVNNTIDEAAFTSNFSTAFVNSPFASDPQDQDEVSDVYRVAIPSGASSLASLPDEGPMAQSITGPYGVFLAGASEDGSHVLFETQAHITTKPGTPVDTHSPGSDELYDRTGGHTYLVGVLPNGSVPSCGVELGDGAKSEVEQGQYVYGAISPDGSNVVFKEGFHCSERSPKIYLRENDTTTVELTGTSYAGRSADGTEVFTEGGNYKEHAEGIYEYNVATGRTTTISPEGWFVAASADGSRVYYWINTEANNAGLYLWEKDGEVKLIGGSPEKAGQGFASEARNLGAELVQSDIAVATPDGSRLLFLDKAQLTSYNNFGQRCKQEPVGHEPTPGFCVEAYVYDAETETITCVSCSPSGTEPLGNTNLLLENNTNTDIAPYSEGEISSDGSRVFYETSDALVPWDTNGLRDVYEWEREGTQGGSCALGSGDEGGGCISLISSGQGSSGTYFAGASSDGNDVFLVTTDHLAAQVQEDSLQIYDARVDGGFPYTPITTGCDSGECQGPQSAAPVFGAPSSAAFVGTGNPPQQGSPVTVPPKKPKNRPGKKRKVHHRKKTRGGKKASSRNGKRGKS